MFIYCGKFLKSQIEMIPVFRLCFGSGPLNNRMMHILLRVIGLAGLLCAGLLFQNCSGSKSQVVGSDREPSSEKPSVNPIIEDRPEKVRKVPIHSIDPDRGADTEIEQGCFATDPIIHQLWKIKDRESLDRYLILQFQSFNGKPREQAIYWSNSAERAGRSLIWKLDGKTEILHINFSVGETYLTYSRDGVLYEVELQCSP